MTLGGCLSLQCSGLGAVMDEPFLSGGGPGCQKRNRLICHRYKGTESLPADALPEHSGPGEAERASQAL